MRGALAHIKLKPATSKSAVAPWPSPLYKPAQRHLRDSPRPAGSEKRVGSGLAVAGTSAACLVVVASLSLPSWPPISLPVPKIGMDNVLIDRSASGFDFRRWTAVDGCGSLAVMSLPPPRSVHGSFPYASPLPPTFQYAPPYLHSSLSLPPLPPRRPPLLPRPPLAKYATLPPPPAAAAAAAAMGKAAAAAGMTAAAAPRRTGLGEYKRKKPRAPRAGGDEPPRAQRRKPLERAAPLPPAPAVDEALDDLEREVARGFIGDLLHALAPPPSSLPLPTFSLVRAAAAKAAAAAPCAV